MFSRENSILNNIQKGILFLIVIFLPFQIDKVFFSENSFYQSYLAFYNVYYLDLTDVLFSVLIIILIYKLFVSREKKQVFNTISTKIQNNIIYWYLIIFWLILVTSSIVSREISLSFYHLWKITQHLLIFVFLLESVSTHNHRLNLKNSGFDLFSRENIFKLLFISGVFQGLLSIYQYLSQSSAGLYFFGEEHLRPGLSGIAEFVSRETFNPILTWLSPRFVQISEYSDNIRAYGTFSHPNILAGFLLTSIVAGYIVYISREKSSIYLQSQNHEKREILNISREILWFLCFLLSITGLVLTFSRIVWVIYAIATIGITIFIFGNIRNRGLLLIFSAMILGSIALNLLMFSSPIHDRIFGVNISHETVLNQKEDHSETVNERLFYNRVALNMMRDNLIFGVGKGNFVIQIDNAASAMTNQNQYSSYFKEGKLLPHLHQPVHNIYLLTAAESGLAGLFAFLLILGSAVKGLFLQIWSELKNNRIAVIDFGLLTILSSFFLIGLFDHYFLSMQSGGLMFWLILALSAVRN